MKTKYRNTYADLLAFICHHYSRLFTLQAITLIFVAFTSMSTLREIPGDAAIHVKIVTFVLKEGILLGGYLLVIGLVSILGMASKLNKAFFTEHTITIDEGGLTEETVFNRSEYKWAGIQKIIITNGYVFAFVSQHAAHVIPRRAFESQAEWDDFVAKLKAFKDHSRLSSPPLPPAPGNGG